jgi:hypothetical protein
MGMWSVALLVNSNDWKDFQANWQLICQTFCSWHMDTPIHSNGHYNILLNKIADIKGDPNIRASINSTRNDEPVENDIFTFSEEQDETFDQQSQLSYLLKVDRIQPNTLRVSYEAFFYLNLVQYVIFYLNLILEIFVLIT